MRYNPDQPAYQRLETLVAERTNPLIIWIGAGLSAQCGLPTWSGLREKLNQALGAKARSQDESSRKTLLGMQERIEGFDNTWLAFQKLKEALGEASFRSTVREALQPAASVDISWGYKYLWRLRPSGILNLNLDRLATRSYSLVRPGGPPLNETIGFSAGERLQILKQHNPFVINLHGTSEAYQSWVLTRKALNALTSSDGYGEFIRTCLHSSTVVFLGLTPEDIAVNGHLRRVQSITRDLGDNFWVTDRLDAETDAWAEEAGLQTIRYRADDGDHSGLKEVLDGLLSYVSEDDPAPVVTRSVTTDADELPEPEDLVGLRANKIREHLNATATEILEPRTEEAYEAYSVFRAKYDEAIFRAWYLDDEPGKNQLFDYTLEQRESQGAFGTVYSARRDGDIVAVKVLHEAMRNEDKALETFRRGIYSMKILEKRGVSGVVSYIDGAEIPAFVAMDWVNGPTLTEAVEAQQLNTWHSRLSVAIQLVSIIRMAHSLPERVLHRDIRPNNIMLQNYYSLGELDVVVLDFDLSWHVGSIEKSVVRDSSPTSYLAPEQLKDLDGVSTRHAAVDSFGLGMSLYFLIAGQRPVPSQHRHDDWQRKVTEAAGRVPCGEWKSLPGRFARLIKNATSDRQSERWDVAQILGELQLLREALMGPESVESAEMIAEELGARTRYSGQMKWDADTYCMRLTIPSGARLKLTGDEGTRRVTLRLVWESSGDFEHKRVSKWIPSATTKAESTLRQAGWSVSSDLSTDRSSIVAEIDASEVVTSLDQHASAVTGSVEALSFH